MSANTETARRFDGETVGMLWPRVLPAVRRRRKLRDAAIKAYVAGLVRVQQAALRENEFTSGNGEDETKTQNLGSRTAEKCAPLPDVSDDELLYGYDCGRIQKTDTTTQPILQVAPGAGRSHSPRQGGSTPPPATTLPQHPKSRGGALVRVMCWLTLAGASLSGATLAVLWARAGVGWWVVVTLSIAALSAAALGSDVHRWWVRHR